MLAFLDGEGGKVAVTFANGVGLTRKQCHSIANDV
jgi:hypothetical protein